MGKQKEYSPEISQLMTDIQNSYFMPDRRIFTYLKRLEKLNRELDDKDLYGFIYFNYARTYSFREDHDALMKYLPKALYFLLRGDDRELLARTYNLFAIEGFKNGALEIAYEYYALAESYVSNMKNSLTYAMIEANMGAFLTHSEEPKRALACLNRCHRIIDKHKDDSNYLGSLFMALLNKCFVMLSLDKTDEAVKLLEQMDAIHPGEELEYLSYIPKCLLAIHKQDKALTLELVRLIERDLIQTEIFVEIVKDLKDLCMALLDNKEFALTKELLDSLEKHKNKIFPYEASLLTQVKIRYYELMQDEEKLLESQAEAYHFSLQLDEMKKKLAYESIHLMHLLVDLRIEKQKASEENLLLQKQAETDALTGLPNRYALNRVLENAFNEAMEKGKLLGIGMADINAFKAYNDRFGHRQGDICLEKIGKKLNALAEKHHFFAARYGGDEFTFIYQNMDAAAIREIEKEICVCEDVTLSHGFYLDTPHEESRMWDYLNKADNKLYEAKKNRG